MRKVSVLWLSGAPGVGKSTVGWGLYTWAGLRDRPVAYVDIDQLGIMVPSSVDDPDRHQLKAANLVGVLDTFRRHGAQQVIVSGVVDPYGGIELALGQDADVELTLIRLHCDRDELCRRYLDRGSPRALLGKLMSEADALRRNAVGSPLDTTALSADEVVEMLSERICGPAPAYTATAPPRRTVAPASHEPAPVLLLAGPTAVGKSTVGWEIFQILQKRGVTAAFIDVDQLGFHRSTSEREIKADNLVHLWRTYRDAGARTLVVVARGTPHRYRQALAAQNITTVYLEASPTELAHRITRRAHGEGPCLPGDSLAAAPPHRQARSTARAVSESRTLNRHRGGARVVDTTRESPSAIANSLVDLLFTLVR